jgi:DNA-binding PadR family transcriptional regulator
MSVRNAILGLLAQHPRHGYELRAAFEAVVGGEGNWDVEPAQIYSTLSRLEESGLIQQVDPGKDNGEDKRIYSLTSAGQQELESWFRTGIEAEHQRDEFFIKLMVCMALDDEKSDPYRIIHIQRNRLYQDLHDITARRSTADPKMELAQILLMDKAIMHLEADLRWLDMIESRLDDIRRQPIPEPEQRPRGRPRKTKLITE